MENLKRTTVDELIKRLQEISKAGKGHYQLCFNNEYDFYFDYYPQVDDLGKFVNLN